MTHQQLRDWLVLSYYGELEPVQEKKLQRHLAECQECRAEKSALEELHLLLENEKMEVDPRLLEQARAQLRGALRQEGSGKAAHLQRLRGWFSLDWLHGGRALGLTAASALIGVVVGMLIFSRQTSLPEQVQLGIDAQIAGLEFVDRELSPGDLDLIYQTVRPVRQSGDLDPPRIERILTEALVSVDNPGVRMRVVNALEERSAGIDREFQRVLIEVLKNDSNVGVRRRALAVLSELALDESLKEAFTHAVVNDPNAGMRVAAINVLVVKAVGGNSLGSELLSRLASGLEGETNNFIRRRSEEFLQEVNYK